MFGIGKKIIENTIQNFQKKTKIKENGIYMEDEWFRCWWLIDWAELAEDGVNESSVVTVTKQYFWQDRARGKMKETQPGTQIADLESQFGCGVGWILSWGFASSAWFRRDRRPSTQSPPNHPLGHRHIEERPSHSSATRVPQQHDDVVRKSSRQTTSHPTKRNTAEPVSPEMLLALQVFLQCCQRCAALQGLNVLEAE